MTLTKVLHKGIFIRLNEYGNAILIETIDGKSEEITVCDGRMRLDPGNSSTAWEEMGNEGTLPRTFCVYVEIILFYLFEKKMFMWMKSMVFHVYIKWETTNITIKVSCHWLGRLMIERKWIWLLLWFSIFLCNKIKKSWYSVVNQRGGGRGEVNKWSKIKTNQLISKHEIAKNHLLSKDIWCKIQPFFVI